MRANHAHGRTVGSGYSPSGVVEGEHEASVVEVPHEPNEHTRQHGGGEVLFPELLCEGLARGDVVVGQEGNDGGQLVWEGA